MNLSEIIDEMRRVLLESEKQKDTHQIQMNWEFAMEIYTHLRTYRDRCGNSGTYRAPFTKDPPPRPERDPFWEFVNGMNSRSDREYKSTFEETVRRAQEEVFKQQQKERYWERKRNTGYESRQSQSSSKKWWDILGISSKATEKEITKAYRRLAMKFHPDRPGGNKEKFQEIEKAKREALGR